MKNKNIAIQIIRIIAMFMIILCHLCNYSSNSIISSLGNFLDVGVFLFLLISGYLYGNKVIDNNAQWLKKRFVTVVIPVYIFLIFLISIIFKTTQDLDLIKCLGYLFNIQYFTGGISGAGHLWFVSVIGICYLLILIFNRYKRIIINKKNIIISIVILLSCIIGLFSKMFGLLGMYLITFYIGYLIPNFREKIEKISNLKCIVLILFAVVARLLGKIFCDDTLFYETTITGITYILISLGIFLIIYRMISKIKISNSKLIRIINIFDELSYYIYIVHYTFIVGPITLLNATSYFLVNILIYSVVTVLSAYTLKIIFDTLINLKLKKINCITLLQNIEIFMIVAYKYILACDFRNNLVLYSLALIAGIITLIIIYKKRKEYKLRDIKNFIILVIFSGITMILLKSINFVFPLLIAASFYNENPKKIFKNFFWSLLIGYITVLELNLFNILPDNNVSRLIEGKQYIRYGLGFINTAFVMLYYIAIVLAGYCSYGCSKKLVIISNFFGIVLYLLCFSRTALVCLIVFNILLIIKQKSKRINKFIKVIVPHTYFILTILMFIFIVVSKHFDTSILNYMLSGRIEFNLEFYETGKLTTLFGVRETLTIPLDSYYLYPLVKFGIIGSIVFMILNYMSLCRLRKSQSVIISTIIVLLYGLGDSNVVVSSINFIMSVQVLALINRDNMYISQGDEFNG